jgi:uncharacterized protein (DUF1810 family)
MPEAFLDHFIEAHQEKYKDALSELKKGQKKTHWMWFIFPIVKGLGKSETAQYYAIESLNEAVSFIEHPYLGENYSKCLEAILRHLGEDIQVILGSGVDKWKFRASLTLFEQATSDEYKKKQIKHCIIEFYGGKKCPKTLKVLTLFRKILK